MIRPFKILLSASLFLALQFFYSQQAWCRVEVPPLVSDGMVLQRDTDARIWGWATPGEEISVRFNKKTCKTRADSNGDWQLTLPKLKVGGPYTMEISGENQITIKDILVGDVWLCSGQSNMETTMKRVEPLYGDVIRNSENDFIRYFKVPYSYGFDGPKKEITGGKWTSASPETILDFGAVAYFFARELYQKYKVPIGLINSSMGGSPIEAWISEDVLREFPEPYDEFQKYQVDSVVTQIENSDDAMEKAWYTKLRWMDEGLRTDKTRWDAADLDDTGWPVMSIPGFWAGGPLGMVNGVVWFRKQFDVPASMAGKEAKLLLGRIVDSDYAWVNGTLVGTTGYQYPPRRYTIPAGVLKEGKNTIAVRVINTSGRGGFVLDKPYQLFAGADTIELQGDWRYRLGARMDPLPGRTFIRWKPVGLYNGMIAPLTRYAIKGVIWYQGESNAGNPEAYDALLPALIRNWREKWGREDLPFLYVQLANFMASRDQPSESNWARIREAQLKTLTVPNTGMAVTIDIGEWNDIHPLNKKDVGRRLALAAQKVAYGESKVVYSGPLYEGAEITGNKVVISFSNTGSGLVAKRADLQGFAIAGKDGKFVWADARIEGDKVVVWHEDVTDPVAVRYAWADNPDKANLYNKEGLPASPFRTDQ